MRVLATLLVLAGSARADVGVQIGPRGGVEFSDDADAYAGVDLRVSSPRSPLAIAVTFDDFFDEPRSLWQLGGTALYAFPIRGRISPYAGVGVGFTSFAYKRTGPDIEDDNGFRVGMNLVAGAALDLGVVSPFVQITQGIGEFDLRTVGAGVLFRARKRRPSGDAPPPDARWVITPYLDNNIAGDVQSGRGGLGVSIAHFFPRGGIGIEVDAELHGHFFRDEDVAGLVGTGVDLNTNAALASANVVVPYCVGGASFGRWCPYATAGAGIVHGVFDGIAVMPGAEAFAAAQTNLAVNGGVGVTHALTRHVGFRVDARYIHAFVDEAAREGGYFKDYGFLRVSVGVGLRFGAARSSRE